jgi:predicted transposase/invertase (TIGR01784 family)
MAGDSGQNNHENLRCRSVYYTSKLFILQDADRYSNLNQTFHIMICDFKIFDDEKFIHRFAYSDGNLILSDICSIIYVELPKIKDRLQKPFDEMTNDERWAFLIEFADDEKFSVKVSEFESEEEYRMAMNVLKNISKNELEQMNYISYLMHEMDYRHDMTASREEGIKQGVKQGIVQGEQKAQLKIAREMALDGMAAEIISRLTHLPLETTQTILSDYQT